MFAEFLYPNAGTWEEKNLDYFSRGFIIFFYYFPFFSPFIILEY